jgi:SRSO17 transposase
MLSGLLMELDDHNCWTIAEAVGHRGPHRLQHLLSRAVWDEQQVLDTAAGWAVSHLDDGDGVLIVDETADESLRPMRLARPANTAAPWAVSRCARWRSP